MIDVLCGIILDSDNKVLIARRKAGKFMAGKWEFPGGKLESNETEEACLQRELMEELGMRVVVIERIGVSEHNYKKGLSIRLIAYRCKFISATFKLTDHDKYAWVKVKDLSSFQLAEADLPLISLI